MTILPKFPAKILNKIDCPELEILLSCARITLDEKILQKNKILLQQELNWKYLLKTASYQGILPLLAYNLIMFYSEAIPEIVLSNLKQYLQRNAVDNLLLTQELIAILKLLETNEIAAIPFKGLVLAASVYGDVALRQISDLDILVRSEDFQVAVELFVSLGYQAKVQVPWECHLIKENGVNIDLHREIVPKHLSSSLSSDYIWQHLEPISLARTNVLTLNPEANLLILSLNGTKECWQSLSRICDVAELIRTYPNLNWQQVMEQGKSMGFERVIFLSLFLARNLLDAKIPDFIWQQMELDPVLPQLIIRVYDKLFSEPSDLAGTVETTLFHIKTRERWQDKVQSAFGLMKLSGWLHPTKRDRQLIPLPGLFSFLYYLIRPIRVLIRYRSVLFNK
ncbi:MAG: nucleotidyltransferase family protein [Cyanobacteria bacterium P01_G01_bin.67]